MPIERYWTMCGHGRADVNDENGGWVFTSRGAEYFSMKHYAVGAGVLVALLVLFAAATGGAVAEVQDGDDRADNETFGAEVSSFMQASTAEAEAEVDEGMFQAAMRRAESADERRQLIEERQARLAARQAELRERRDELSADEPAAKNRALATRVQVGADGLERSVESTENHAARVGVDAAQLAALRQEARSLKNDVTDLAREMAGQAGESDGRWSGDDGWPGDDRGNGSDRSGDDRGNGSVDVSDDRFDRSEESDESDS